MTGRLQWDRGAVVLSLDVERIWGYHDVLDEAAFERLFPRAVEAGEDLLRSLCDARLSATWAVVGGMCLRGLGGPEDPRLAGLPRSWTRTIPAGDENTAPLWYARSFLERVRDARVRQDIGLHGGLTHLPWGDPEPPAEVLRAELEGGVKALAELGITPRSFVFPRNLNAAPDLLASCGIRCYRGKGPAWSARLQRTLPGSVMGVVEEVGRWTPPPVWPRLVRPGLWDLPASLFLYRMTPVRNKVIPLATRRVRVRRGIEAAARCRGVFHLYLHPENLAESPEAPPVFAGVLEEIVRARRAGDIETLTMSEVAERMEARTQAGAA